MATDTRVPYRVYGTQQDNSAICVPSRSFAGAILPGECYPVGSSESGYIAVRPDDPNIVFSGAVGSAPGGGGVLLRYDHRTGQSRMITVWPEVYYGWGPKDLRHRFQWTFPIVLSPHDPTVLYAAGNLVFRSTDEGGSLGADQPGPHAERRRAPGPVRRPDHPGHDGRRALLHGVRPRRVPAGGRACCGRAATTASCTSRGTAAKTWSKVTPPDMPEWATVVTIEPSRHARGKAYLAATRYKLDDTRPYLCKTDDYGATWTSIASNLAADDFTRVVREDPVRPGLLYAGTETGVHVSFDDGRSWRSLSDNLPAVPVYDLAVKGGDLVAATHGRSFWILDDLDRLRQFTDAVRGAPVHLFTPATCWHLVPPIHSGTPTGPGKNYAVALGYAATFTEAKTESGEVVRRFLDAGTNPPNGVVVSYYLAETPAGEVTLRFRDAAGRLVRELSSIAGAGPGAPAEPRPTKNAGLNRFVWNLRHAPARALVPADVLTERTLAGPVVPPGRYRVELGVDGRILAADVEVKKDPRITASTADLEAACAFLLRVRDKISEVHDAVNRLREVRRQVQDWITRSAGHAAAAEVEAAGRGLTARIDAIERELTEPRARVDGDRLIFPARLSHKLTAVPSVVASADFAPTRQVQDVFAELAAQADGAVGRWRTLLGSDVPPFAALLRDRQIPIVG